MAVDRPYLASPCLINRLRDKMLTSLIGPPSVKSLIDSVGIFSRFFENTICLVLVDMPKQKSIGGAPFGPPKTTDPCKGNFVLSTDSSHGYSYSTTKRSSTNF